MLECCTAQLVGEPQFSGSIGSEGWGNGRASKRITNSKLFIRSGECGSGRRGVRALVTVIALLMGVLGLVMTFLSVPYSKTQAEFISLTKEMLQDVPKYSGVFTEEDISRLPYPVKKYFRYCGYMNMPKMNSMKAEYRNVRFVFGRGKHPFTIDYTQYNCAEEPARIAYISSSMRGIPFEGIDSFIAGKGSMKGVLAKLIILFRQGGKTMDKASMVNYLSECLIFPNAALQDYITWEEVDTLHAKATTSCFGGNVSGIFAFNDTGEMVSFTTDDREATSADGKSKKVRWSIILSDYQETDKIKKPTGFQAIWHYETGDLLYFDGENVSIEFDPQLM